MPNTRSAKKRLRQTEKRRLRNKSVKSRVKTLVKKVLACIENKEKEKLEEALKAAMSAIDKAVEHGILHKNTGARKKSRLMKKVNEFLKSAA